MVTVGSFDAWLATTRPPPCATSRVASNNMTMDSLSWSSTNAPSSTTCPSASSSVAITGLQARDEFPAVTPRHSLLTAQLRETEQPRTDATNHGIEPNRWGTLCLDRAMSEPELHQNPSRWLLPSRDAVSSPQVLDTLTYLQVIDEQETSGPTTASLRRATCLMNLELSSESQQPDQAFPFTSHCLGPRTAARHNVYDGTVRGGYPRKVRDPGLQTLGCRQQEPWAPTLPPTQEMGTSMDPAGPLHCSAQQQHHHQVLPSSPFSTSPSQPRYLADMLRHALQKN